MTKRDGIRIITELEAAEKLLARGYTTAACHACHHCAGVGYFTLDDMHGMCPTCAGAGWVWVEPPPSK